MKLIILLSLLSMILFIYSNLCIKSSSTMTVFPKLFFKKNVSSNFLKKLMKKKIFLHSNHLLLALLPSLFLSILIINYLGFIPFSLCLTSHIGLTIPLGCFFFFFSLFKLSLNEWKNFFLHLIMDNVPLILSPMLIIIESVGVLIRPLTLSIRLAANMTAGHLIMFIVCSMLSLMLIDVLILLFLVFIFFLETFVCFIQAYVFSMLSSMYIFDNN